MRFCVKFFSDAAYLSPRLRESLDLFEEASNQAPLSNSQLFVPCILFFHWIFQQAKRRRISGSLHGVPTNIPQPLQGTPVLRGKGKSSHLPVPTDDLSHIDALFSSASSSVRTESLNHVSKMSETALVTTPSCSSSGKNTSFRMDIDSVGTKKRRKTGVFGVDSKAECMLKKQKTSYGSSTVTDSSEIPAFPGAALALPNMTPTLALPTVEENWWHTIDDAVFSNVDDALDHMVQKVRSFLMHYKRANVIGHF